MSWTIQTNIGEMRPWPDVVELERGSTGETLMYVPERTCRIEHRNGEWYCTCCEEMVGTIDTASEMCISGNAIDMWRCCPFCGARVVGGGE